MPPAAVAGGAQEPLPGGDRRAGVRAGGVGMKLTELLWCSLDLKPRDRPQVQTLLCYELATEYRNVRKRSY